MNILDAVHTLTAAYRSEVVFATSSDDYDPDCLSDWAAEALAAEEEEGEPAEYAVDDAAIYPVDGGFIQHGQPVVRVKTLTGWDADSLATSPRQLDAATWPTLAAWRQWAEAV